ncbi:hypothetical protein J6590_101285 [Homalodisca vitripennis]|nr:hypothetical protein J6590_101285 [Homalodisca vitripennis]
MEVTETDPPNKNILFREFPKTAGTKLSGRIAAREDLARGINLRRSKYLSSHAQEGPPPQVGSGTSIYSSLFYQLCGSYRTVLFTLQLLTAGLYKRSLRFDVRIATKWQRSGHRASGRVPSSSGGTARGCHHNDGGLFTPP